MKRNGSSNPPPPIPPTRPLLPVRPPLSSAEASLTVSSSISSSSQSPQDFLRHVQAALKRHRPHSMDLSGLRASRVPVSSTTPPCSTSSTLTSTLTNLASSNERKSAVTLSSPSPQTAAEAKPESKSHQKREGSTDPERNQCNLLQQTEISGFPVKQEDKSGAREGQRNGDPITQPSVNRSSSDPKPNQCNLLQQTEVSGFHMKIEDGTEAREAQQIADPITQASVTGSCATALSLHPAQGLQSTRQTLPGQTVGSTQMSSCVVNSEIKPPETTSGVHEIDSKVNQQSEKPQNQVNNDDGGSKGEPSQSTRGEKPSSKKRKYDADSFFKVQGKLYQKLGKIGSGGSSEVYKVITSDCTIYALKKIILKGRDYPTAYGFCQEIEYLKKLRGKSNIIQLIDYEVTDKTLFEEVLTRGTNSKHSSIKDDVYIYMVLEYGEIDLARMLSLKWKDFDKCNWISYETWIRFYWLQMLEAVNTIHEERIVHSDLKPANFLLVQGSLKLIDFGIAKAISSDTTNIQRDSQVGTLNYMSPEAYLCNEHDAGGNMIKCGRPSDIWSLGCILYQMVYGQTPFADHKSIWAKYKVVTDRNHKIVYKPVSNPSLVDLMKKCLAWDRNERWRIPQLLQHPFLAPSITLTDVDPPDSDKNQRKLKSLFRRIEAYSRLPEGSNMADELEKFVAERNICSIDVHDLG
ncbi:uncharacterized protein LOC144713714 isoform X2 [Wolffia australiana]